MSPSLPVVFLACKVFEGIVASKNDQSNIFLDYGLHSIPKQLKLAVQEEINAIQIDSVCLPSYLLRLDFLELADLPS